MSVTHPSGSDLESMNEFYDKKILRAVTLILLPLFSTSHVFLEKLVTRLVRAIVRLRRAAIVVRECRQ